LSLKTEVPPVWIRMVSFLSSFLGRDFPPPVARKLLLRVSFHYRTEGVFRETSDLFNFPKLFWNEVFPFSPPKFIPSQHSPCRCFRWSFDFASPRSGLFCPSFPPPSLGRTPINGDFSERHGSRLYCAPTNPRRSKGLRTPPFPPPPRPKRFFFAKV